MSDPRDKLRSLYLEQHRYHNFGEAIVRMHVEGFRCHLSTTIEFSSPITAFCGLNGTGKSTLLQLAAAAYRSSTPRRRYYIRDFLVSGRLDSNPFRDTALIRYEYLRTAPTVPSRQPHRVVTVSRLRSKWSGYKRQPQRNVYFAGMGLYLPKIESRDFVVRHAQSITINNTLPIPDETKQKICSILSCSYDVINSNDVTYEHRSTQVVTVERGGNSYSEANMGCGEGRIQHIIRVLEALPGKSLVLLEEPETSLHPSAQHEFAKYLMDVCIRKRHQIILTTHSEFVLQALPSSSTIYLHRTPTGIFPIPGITASQAKSLMTEGHVKALHVFVEDEVAKSVLREIILRIDPQFLQVIEIHPLGDEFFIGKAAEPLQATGLPISVVRDADKGDNPKKNIFKLPGTMPPEKEIFQNTQIIDHINSIYGFDLTDFNATLADVDHHEWFERLASRIGQDKSALINELSRIYARNIPENDATTLIQLLKEAMRR